MDLSKGDAKRLHLLEAAAGCFREHGFHGTSIARISEAAGMSAGHIYHYFRNKEAIVEGIVARDLEQTLERAQALRKASVKIGPVQACIEQVDAGIALRSDKGPAYLGIEILAEATRNPEVARMLEQSDRLSRQSTMETLLGRAEFAALPPAERSARVSVMHALFDGLIVRSLVDPTLDPSSISQVIQRLIRVMLEDDPSA